MPRSPYPGFKRLNDRRLDLVEKKYHGGGLTETEEREMEMLGTCISAMCHYRWPYRDIDKDFKEKFGCTLEEFMAKHKLDGDGVKTKACETCSRVVWEASMIQVTRNGVTKWFCDRQEVTSHPGGELEVRDRVGK